MVTDNDLSQQYFPYPTTDYCGQAIIPENLGYVEAEKPDAEPIIAAAHRLAVVRDPIASFFFHPFMPSKYLVEILAALQRDGYRFISINDFGPSLALGQYAVSAVPRSLTFTPQQPYLKTVTLDAGGDSHEEIEPSDPPGVDPRTAPPRRRVGRH